MFRKSSGGGGVIDLGYNIVAIGGQHCVRICACMEQTGDRRLRTLPKEGNGSGSSCLRSLAGVAACPGQHSRHGGQGWEG